MKPQDNDNEKSITEITEEVLSEIDSAIDKVNTAKDYGEKAKRLIDYRHHGNSEEREQLKQEVRKWRAKEYTLRENFKIFWIFMIVLAILELTFFRKIGQLFGIENGLILFLLVGGTFVLFSLVFSSILFKFRK